MIRKILIFCCVVTLSLFSGCEAANSTHDMSLAVDDDYDRAIVSLADGTTVSGYLQSWCHVDDRVIVVIDGVKYYTTLSNVTLIKTEK